MTTETTETRNRKRVNLTLAPATVAKLGDCLNASRYVDRLVAARDREWRAALAGLRAGGFTLEEINIRVNDPACRFNAGLTGRRFALLADELDAGNHAVHAALQEDEDEADANAARRAEQDRRADFLMGPGYERAARLRREQQSEARAYSINKGRAIAKVLR